MWLDIIVPFVLSDAVITPPFLAWINSQALTQGIFGDAWILLAVLAPGIIADLLWLGIKEKFKGR